MNRRAFTTTLSATLTSAMLSRSAHGAPQPTRIRIRRLTWAGVQLALGDRTLLIDPLLTPAAWQPSFTGAVIPIELATPNATVLVTHLHPDHFDPVGLRGALANRPHVVSLAAKAPSIAGAGFGSYGLQHFEPLVLGPWSIVPVPAEDGNGEEQVSWVIRGGGRRFIHSGDTMWHGQWWRIGREYGPFDLAFLPINGADLRLREPHVDVPATMTPEQAVAAAVVLGARAVCPIHYGFNDPERYREYPNALATFSARAAARDLATRILQPGEWMEMATAG